MTLHWATAFAVGGSATNYTDSGWTLVGVDADDMRNTGNPRQPLCGYGGQAFCANLASSETFRTPAFPQGALSDGLVQIHFRLDTAGDGNIFALYSGSTVVLRLTTLSANTGAGVGRTPLLIFNVDSARDTAALVDRGNTSIPFNSYSWHVLTIRYATGAVTNTIEVSIDGENEVLTAIATNPYAGTWDSIYITGVSITSGITVWDSAGDDAQTVTYWMPYLRPSDDATDGSWTNQAGSAVNLYESVNDATISTADYVTTTTNPDTVRFDLNPNDIDASWNPATIAGCAVWPSGRGDGTINQSEVTCHSATPADSYGTIQTTTTTTKMNFNDVFALDPDGAAFTAASIGTHEWGVRAT